jgi:phosphatidylglycerol:prolipoprotein diacylglycerol transferase
VIPYVEQPSIAIGPLTIHAFGFLAALGVLIGAKLATRAAARYSAIDPTPLSNAIPWAVAGGVLGGHLLHVLGYHPELLTTQGPLVILKLWDGQSSMGGVLGGLLGFIVYFRRHKIALFPYLDALALGAAPGWAVARLGCFAAHDHPGVRTDFPLAVAFPGGARHDLGLYDALVLAALSLALYLIARQRRTNGTLIALLAIGYGVPRFFLDFLRARDIANADGRFLGLTPAQYIAVALVITGAWILVRIRRETGVSRPLYELPA